MENKKENFKLFIYPLMWIALGLIMELLNSYFLVRDFNANASNWTLAIDMFLIIFWLVVIFLYCIAFGIDLITYAINKSIKEIEDEMV